MAESLTSLNARKNCIVLANAASLASGIIKEIAGNDIANSINGSVITKDIIHSLTMQRIMKNLDTRERG